MAKAEAPPKPAEIELDLPKTEEPKRNPAVDLLANKLVRDRMLEENRVTAEEAENLHFLRCPRVWEHHAVYLTEHPRGRPIHSGMWYSIYHERGEPWVMPKLYCQQCYVEGQGDKWSPHLTPRRRPDGTIEFVLSADEKYVIGRVSRADLERVRAELQAKTAKV